MDEKTEKRCPMVAAWARGSATGNESGKHLYEAAHFRRQPQSICRTFGPPQNKYYQAAVAMDIGPWPLSAPPTRKVLCLLSGANVAEAPRRVAAAPNPSNKAAGRASPRTSSHGGCFLDGGAPDWQSWIPGAPGVRLRLMADTRPTTPTCRISGSTKARVAPPSWGRNG